MEWWTANGLLLAARAIALGAALLVSACGMRPDEAAPQILTLQPSESIPLSGPSPLVKPGPAKDVLNILALSGGGADGAFGAGVLNGWSQSGKRPKFDVVTGVSAGAFMAALAFLGPKYDKTLADLYTNQTNSSIYIQKGPEALLSDSLLDNTPLKQQIERIVTKEFVAEVAAEHAAGRRLYIATTNLDSGDLVIWDMGQIATGDRADRVQMFQKILRASAAVPGFFMPVYIKPQKGIQQRQAHVDGAVKAPVLIGDFMFKSPARQRNLYVVINGSLAKLNNTGPIKPSVSEIGKKSIVELLRSLSQATIYQGYVTAKNAKTEFNLVAVPDAVMTSADALDFNPLKMRELFRLGLEFGKKGGPWLKEPPRLEALQRVSAPAAR
ncbi:MAG: hypothetical protein F9K44_06320 [Hyphomicrobiaceae bacterium]|nr:MAG: hypothetical protein F9K44_06320 [Hyphomicrobiaceae bacterium]